CTRAPREARRRSSCARRQLPQCAKPAPRAFSGRRFSAFPAAWALALQCRRESESCLFSMLSALHDEGGQLVEGHVPAWLHTLDHLGRKWNQAGDFRFHGQLRLFSLVGEGQAGDALQERRTVLTERVAGEDETLRLDDFGVNTGVQEIRTVR